VAVEQAAGAGHRAADSTAVAVTREAAVRQETAAIRDLAATAIVLTRSRTVRQVRHSIVRDAMIGRPMTARGGMTGRGEIVRGRTVRRDATDQVAPGPTGTGRLATVRTATAHGRIDPAANIARRTPQPLDASRTAVTPVAAHHTTAPGGRDQTVGGTGSLETIAPAGPLCPGHLKLTPSTGPS
jgi:hypothetical protein